MFGPILYVPFAASCRFTATALGRSALSCSFPDLREPDTDLQWVMTDAARSETAVDVTARLIFPEDAGEEERAASTSPATWRARAIRRRHLCRRCRQCRQCRPMSPMSPMSPMTPMTTNERAAGSGAEHATGGDRELAQRRSPRTNRGRAAGSRATSGVMTTAATSGPFKLS